MPAGLSICHLADIIHSASCQTINNFPIILSGQAAKIHLMLFVIDAVRKLSIISPECVACPHSPRHALSFYFAALSWPSNIII